MKPAQAWVRRGQRVIRMVSELHRLGYQRLRIFPYEYPLAWRLCIAPADRFSWRNGAYVEHGGGEFPTYSSGMDNRYFGWEDAAEDNARGLADKFLLRFPEVCARGRGRDWPYAGWLAELVGFLESQEALPFVAAEYFEPRPEGLTALPIRWLGRGYGDTTDFPLPPAPP